MTRKNRKRKGGFLGIRALKTKTENSTNCQRLANNFTKRSDFLYRKYKCASINPMKECRIIDKKEGLYQICANKQIMEDYDFSRDGLHVKQRTRPFFGSDKVPSDVDGKPWNEMTYHFNQPVESLKEYVLKTDEIVKEN